MWSGFNTRSFGFVKGLIDDNGSGLTVSGDIDLKGNNINNIFNLTVNGCIQSNNPFVQICSDLIVQGKTTTTSLEVENETILNGPLCMPGSEPTNTTNLINITSIGGSPTSTSMENIKDASLVYDSSNKKNYIWDGNSWKLLLDENNFPTLEQTLLAGNTSGANHIIIEQNLIVDGTITSNNAFININKPLKNTSADVTIDDNLNVTENLILGGEISSADSDPVIISDALALPSGQATNSTSVLSLPTFLGVPTNITVREGSLAWDENNDDLYIFDGTTWKTISSGPIGGAPIIVPLAVTTRTDFNDFTVAVDPSYWGRIDWTTVATELTEGTYETIVISNSAITSTNDMVLIYPAQNDSVYASPAGATVYIAQKINNPVGTFTLKINHVKDPPTGDNANPTIFYQIVKTI